MEIKWPENGDDWGTLAVGVAAGIGLVTALPIFGPVGRVSALGAVIGGLAGSAVSLVDFGDECSEEDDDNEGFLDSEDDTTLSNVVDLHT